MTDSSPLTVAVVGASPKPERYSNKAVRLLREQGYDVLPVHPALAEIEGLPVYARLEDLPRRPHTVTLYVGPVAQAAITESLLALAPARVIFNPGAENPALAAALRARGVLAVEACTLVMLRTGQF